MTGGGISCIIASHINPNYSCDLKPDAPTANEKPESETPARTTLQSKSRDRTKTSFEISSWQHTVLPTVRVRCDISPEQAMRVKAAQPDRCMTRPRKETAWYTARTHPCTAYLVIDCHTWGNQLRSQPRPYGKHTQGEKAHKQSLNQIRERVNMITREGAN